MNCPQKTILKLKLEVVLALLPLVLQAQKSGSHNHHQAPAGDVGTISGLAIPDVELVDQNGKRVHFHSDLVKGKVVAINTIFTTCTTICPTMGANFSRLSNLLAAESRDKLNLISISIDPVVDTPERLKQWSLGFGHAGPNWTLLTGSKSDIEVVLKALQIFAPEKQDHTPLVLIGGEGTGEWARASALLAPSRLADLIRTRLEVQP